MPEFILDTCDAPPAWAALDDFARGFVEALFFCECSCIDAAEFWTRASQRRIREGQADGSIPRDAGVCDVPAAELQQVAAFCKEFQTRAAAELAEAYGRPGYDETRAGHDFYYTRAGHGVGYWSRDELEPDSAEYEAARAAVIAARHDNAAWDRAVDARNALKESSVGQRLTRIAGQGEISAFADRDKAAPNGFRVSFYLT